MSINWRDARIEKPTEPKAIWGMITHWKKNIPGSFRIYGGEYEVNNQGKGHRLQTCDDFGEGSFSIPFIDAYQENQDYYNIWDDSCVEAWCYQDEINVPEFLMRRT